MSTFFTRSLILACAPLALALTACVGASGAEEEEETIANEDNAVQATQFMDTNLLKGYLTQMWKKQLNTTRDAANGKWYTSGADGDSPAGLYGALSLTPDNQITVDKTKKKYTSGSAVALACITDNRNGLNPKLGCTLKSTAEQTTTTTHKVQDALEVGVGYTVKGSVFFAEESFSMNVKYTHTWGTDNAKTTSYKHEFDIPCEAKADVPKGQVWKCEVVGILRNFEVPYKVTAHASGFTETWFSDRVNGHYNYALSGSDAFKNIGAWGLAGGDSSGFSSAGITQTGTLAANTVGEFTTKITNITSSYPKKKKKVVGSDEPLSAREAAGEDAQDYEGSVIEVSPVLRETIPPGLTIVE